jgi:hypothetical protein
MIPMKRAIPLILLSLASSFLLGQEKPAKPSPKITTLPLTADQKSVYRDFLLQFRSSPSQPMNVAELTFIFEPDDADYSGCMKDFQPKPPLTEIHRLGNNFATENGVKTIDPQQHKIVDPMESMQGGQSAELATKKGFGSGILYVSEIVFDARHKHAALRYGFICGGLCGNSETVVLEKRKGGWRRSRQSCGYGVS